MAKPKPTGSMMGIASPTGSHLPVLGEALRKLDDGRVIEHGAGLYSTPLLAQLSHLDIVCCEPNAGWAEWARWIYSGRALMLESFKDVVPLLADAELVFLDGPARERGLLLQRCLDLDVPTIIAHDTQPAAWAEYGYQPHMFIHPAYNITQHAEDTHRTTLWTLRS